MSTRKVSKLIAPTVAALGEELNGLIIGLGATGQMLHYEEGAVPIATADGTDLATALVLANALRTAYIAHALSTAKHSAADATNVTAAAAATDQATLNTLVNELQLDLDAHAQFVTPHRAAGGLWAKVNAMFQALTQLGVFLHRQAPQVGDVIDTADATDLTTLIALVNEVKTDYVAHIADVAKHLAADAANGVSAADATDQTTVNTLADELKVDLNAHHVLATSHVGVGGGQGNPIPVPVDISTANSTDLATGLVLVNAERDAYNLHVRSGADVAPEGLVGVPVASNLATSLVLVNAVKVAYNLHVPSGAQELDIAGT